MPTLPRLPGLLLLSLATAVVGCRSSSGPDLNPPPHWANPHTDLSPTAEPYPVLEQDAAAALQVAASRQASKPPAKPLNALCLSGGGQYGAYAVGLLAGWSARGDRPDFDVVTGISSGALIAPLAFLGPRYDPVLKEVWDNLETDQLFKYRPIPVHILRDKALASSDPMKALIARIITPQVMDDIRAAHRCGRRLFVGTSTLHARRLIVWDLGAVACSGHPEADELVRTILLATSSIPGLVPPVDLPVEVNGVTVCEQHTDGGAVAQTFLRLGGHHPRPDPADPAARWLCGSNVYVIAGGKLYIDPIQGDLGFLSRATGAVSAALYALYRADLWRLYSFCQASGMGFHHTDIPRELPTPGRSTEFETETLRSMYAAGYQFSVSGKPWRQTPPGCEPGEEEKPRAGLRFTVP
jgi:hypothetical protein